MEDEAKSLVEKIILNQNLSKSLTEGEYSIFKMDKQTKTKYI